MAINLKELKERRKNKRLEHTGLTANITDGNRLFNGEIKDVSLHGFKVQIPHRLKIQNIKYVIVISGKKINLKLIAQPCWHNNTSNLSYQEIGFRTILTRSSWTYCIQNLLQ